MLEFKGKEWAIEEINRLSNLEEPFLFLINFDQSQTFVSRLAEIPEDVLKFEIEGLRNYQPNELIGEKKNTFFDKHPLAYPEFQDAYNKVHKQINFGNSFLTNLTFETEIETNLSLEEIFYRSSARYKVFLKDHFTCFSPEIFIKVKGDKISSFPMKGTIDAAIKGAEKQVLEDPKEMAEHVTIVDLIRNDLSMVAKKVEVPRFRYTERIRNNQSGLVQVSSEVTGELLPEFQSNWGSLLFKLLPAGSISGAPKPQTLDVIREAESHDRGFYTGICGVFDGHELNCGVMIRFIAQREGRFFFKSGGGITYLSDPQKEYHEYIDKIYLPF